MKQINLILLILLSVYLTEAQNYETTEMDGHEFFVYPYPVSDFGVFPTIDSLPDGNWLAFKPLGMHYEGEIPQYRFPNIAVNTSMRDVEFVVKNGVKEGEVKIFDQGRLVAEGFYHMDLQSGKWSFYDSDSSFIGICHFKEGVLHGVMEEYYNNGKIKRHGNWENGRPIGEWIKYHENGQPAKKFSIKDCNENVKEAIEQKQLNSFQNDSYNGSGRRNTFSKFPYMRPYELGTCFDGEWLMLSETGDTISSILYNDGVEVIQPMIVGNDSLFYPTGALKWKRIKKSKWGVEEIWFHSSGKMQRKLVYELPRSFDDIYIKLKQEFTLHDQIYDKIDKYYETESFYNEKGELTDSILYNNQKLQHEALWIESYYEGKPIFKFKYDTASEDKTIKGYDSKENLIYSYLLNNKQQSFDWQSVNQKDVKMYYQSDINQLSFTTNNQKVQGKFQISLEDFSHKRIYFSQKEHFLFKEQLKYWKGELDNGLMVGEWKGYDEMDRLRIIAYFSNGQINGTYTRYNYFNDDKRKLCISRDKNQYVYSDEIYKEGKRDGWLNYYYPNGQIMHKSRFSEGLAQSGIFGYYEKGSPKYEVLRKDSLFEYRDLVYGSLWSISNFKDSISLNNLADKPVSSTDYFSIRKHGPYFQYNRYGGIESTGNYTNGDKSGEWIDWNINGTKSHSILLKEDSESSLSYYLSNSDYEQNGYHEYYYSNGKRESEGEVVNHKRNGIWKYYFQDGGLEERINYYQDTIQVAFVNDTCWLPVYGSYNSFYKNGMKKVEGFIFEKDQFEKLSYNALKEGIFYFNVYDRNGDTIVSQGRGELIDFTLNDSITMLGKVVGGFPEGEWFYKNASSKEVEYGQFSKGKREGRWLKGDIEELRKFKDYAFEDLYFETFDEMQDFVLSKTTKSNLLIQFYKEGRLINYLGYRLYFHSDIRR